MSWWGSSSSSPGCRGGSATRVSRVQPPLSHGNNGARNLLGTATRRMVLARNNATTDHCSTGHDVNKVGRSRISMACIQQTLQKKTINDLIVEPPRAHLKPASRSLLHFFLLLLFFFVRAGSEGGPQLRHIHTHAIGQTSCISRAMPASTDPTASDDATDSALRPCPDRSLLLSARKRRRNLGGRGYGHAARHDTNTTYLS